MAAISTLIAARSEYAISQLAKRDKNWAQREPGVIVVFVIVFLVVILLIGVFISKRVCHLQHLLLGTTLTAFRSEAAKHKIPLVEEKRRLLSIGRVEASKDES